MSVNKTHPQPVVLMLVLDMRGGRQSVLLGRKLRGFGAGHVVAPGGKVEPGERALDAAVRELREETSLRVAPQDAHYRALILFRFPARPASDMDCQVFTAARHAGSARDSAELAVRWHPVDALPVEQMWQDAEHWLPRIIAGERFTATVTMAADNLHVKHVEVSSW